MFAVRFVSGSLKCKKMTEVWLRSFENETATVVILSKRVREQNQNIICFLTVLALEILST